MKLIVKEHINKIAKPTVKKYTVIIDAVNNYNKIPAGIGLMKGDLIAFRGAGDPVRLPVGSDGKVLTADSSTATGLVWTEAAGGGGGATVEIYNQTGATIPAGSVVGAVPYIGADDFVGLEMFRAQKYTAGTLYILSDNCPNNSTVQCYCVPDTVCPVLCDTDAVAQDDILGVSANGACHSLESYDTLPLGRATVGIALEAKAEGSVGTVKVRLVSNPTMQAHSESAVSTTYGTCFMVDESADSTFRVAPVKKGKIPFGVQANKESVAGAAVLLHTNQNEEVAVMADTTEIKVGDWLVPSATADGQVRNGSGYGIGEALTAKTSGPAGLVKVHLNLKYGISPRAWWLPSGITEDQVLAAYQFVGRASEAEALINVNNGTEYALTKSGATVVWNQSTGLYFTGTGDVLTNSALTDQWQDLLSAAFGYSGATDAGISGGIGWRNYRQLQIRALGANSTNINAHTISRPSATSSPQKAGTFYTEGILGGNWDSTPILYHNGEVIATTASSTSIGDMNVSNARVLGQYASTSKAFYCTAIAFYKTLLTSEQHLELANNIKALGGAGA